MTFSQKAESLKEQIVFTALSEQVNEELDGDFSNTTLIKMVNQKYGLIPPQLTASERNLIIREERKWRPASR